MDLQELGTWSEASTTTDQSGASSPDGATPVVKKKRVRVFTPEQREYWRLWHKKHYQATKHINKQVLTPEQKERKKAWTRRQYAKKNEHYRMLSRRHYHKHKDAILSKLESIRKSNPEIKVRVKRYAELNRDKIREKNKKRYHANKAINAEKRKAYLPRRRELCKLRRAENPTRKIAENCRSRIYNMVTRFNPNRTYKTFDLVGCTPDFFVAFLEAQFTPEMNWENYGTFWNIDHRIPISSFRLEDESQLRLAFHYSNCRPLRAVENSEKNDSLPGPHQPLLV